MKRRTLMERIGAAGLATVAAAGVAAGTHEGDCHDAVDDPDCQFDEPCSEIDCPSKCCECICLH